MDEGNRPWKRPTRNPHAISTRQSPPIGVTTDLGAGVKDLDIGQVADPPTSIDEPPAEFDLLVAVEQLGEVTADLLVGGAADGTRPAEEICDITGLGDVGIARSRDVTT